MYIIIFIFKQEKWEMLSSVELVKLKNKLKIISRMYQHRTIKLIIVQSIKVIMLIVTD